MNLLATAAGHKRCIRLILPKYYEAGTAGLALACEIAQCNSVLSFLLRRLQNKIVHVLFVGRVLHWDCNILVIARICTSMSLIPGLAS